ncbi:hypothetical protein V22_25480 [Calycomorphotria hydatis]|uniref:Uncharacterized protein n=1 Tax=Calycomorphotria hydatis TaxID=2528027 RepID=A0A517TA98_9PLAN|nr:hypothetical protein V22_25480 [Calycomorphotria hydatis]
MLNYLIIMSSISYIPLGILGLNLGLFSPRNSLHFRSKKARRIWACILIIWNLVGFAAWYFILFPPENEPKGPIDPGVPIALTILVHIPIWNVLFGPAVPAAIVFILKTIIRPRVAST